MRAVEARYENGSLKPAKPLPLRSGERVGVIVVRLPDAKRWDVSRLMALAADDEQSALARVGLDDWTAALDRPEIKDRR